MPGNNKYSRKWRRADETKRIQRKPSEIKRSVWSGIVDYPPQDVKGYERIYLARRSDGPCIYLYSGIQLSFFLRREIPNSNKFVSYLNEKHGIERSYFKVGDKIFGGENTEHELYRMFPGLKRPESRDSDWTRLFWWFLNEGEQDTYKNCRVIKGIYPDGKGGGKIETAGYIHFGGYNIELASEKESRLSMNQRFIHHSYDFTVITWMAKAVTKGSVIALSGISKGLTAPAKLVLKKVIIKESRRIASRKIRIIVLKAIFRKTSVALRSAVKEFIKTFVIQLRKQEMRKKFFKANKVNTLNWNAVEPAIMDATVSFMGSLLDSSFDNTIGREIRNTKTYNEILKEIKIVVLKSFRTTPIKVLITAIKSSDRKARYEKKDFWIILEEEIYSSLGSSVEEILTKDIPSVFPYS